ncbi:MAG TPA: DUF1127 domain-containing protein [Candidatus Competibacter sp.]|mgnify:CR=1 FL=1|nr:DUF1127 domain-containing protein [Candidatus Competibacter sp.]
MYHDTTLCLEHPVHRNPGVGAPHVGIGTWLRDRYAVYRQRRALLALDEAMLKDMGISRADAFREGDKPFWRS